MSGRWLVAMSGGVDSSVAAGLLARRGVEVIGMTMDLGEGSARDVAPRNPRKCCGLPDAEDARAVARRLGFRHYTANYRQAFRDAVVEPFVDAYEAGRTPIPCIACNRVLKFDLLLERAAALGAEGVATGHYARIAPGPDGAPALYRPRDRAKDQTYFLFDVPRERLARMAFPLGDLDKAEVREIARDLGLCNADKPESQGICFVPDGDVRAALGRLRPDRPRTRGEIVDRAGRILGQHDGAVGFTQGQRRGLGLSGGPWYVVEVQTERNRVVVERDAQALRRRRVRLERVTWHDGAPPTGATRLQVRHRHASVACRVVSESADAVLLALETPAWAPAPGQAGVVYDAADARVLGGGWIAATA